MAQVHTKETEANCETNWRARSRLLNATLLLPQVVVLLIHRRRRRRATTKNSRPTLASMFLVCVRRKLTQNYLIFHWTKTINRIDAKQATCGRALAGWPTRVLFDQLGRQQQQQQRKQRKQQPVLKGAATLHDLELARVLSAGLLRPPVVVHRPLHGRLAAQAEETINWWPV